MATDLPQQTSTCEPCHAHAEQGHDHGHREASKQALSLVLVLSTLYLIVEVLGGFLTNSLALLADAGHMFTDVAALALSLAAMWFASRPPTPKRSFGYYRLEILAALLNGSVLIVVSGGIFYEMSQRLWHPPTIAGLQMGAIALGGLIVNLLGAWILMRSAKHNMNVKGALLHVVGDALGSVAAVVAAFLIWRFGWYVADPILSGVVALLVMRSAWGLITDSVDILLQTTPLHIDPAEVVHAIEGVDGVQSSHDLHIWTVTSGMISLSCHIVIDEVEKSMTILETLKKLLAERFDIEHATLQVEACTFNACQRLHW